MNFTNILINFMKLKLVKFTKENNQMDFTREKILASLSKTNNTTKTLNKG